MRVPLIFRGVEYKYSSERERPRRRCETLLDEYGHKVIFYEGVEQIISLNAEQIQELLKHEDIWIIPLTARFYAHIT